MTRCAELDWKDVGKKKKKGPVRIAQRPNLHARAVFVPTHFAHSCRATSRPSAVTAESARHVNFPTERMIVVAGASAQVVARPGVAVATVGATSTPTAAALVAAVAPVEVRSCSIYAILLQFDGGGGH